MFQRYDVVKSGDFYGQVLVTTESLHGEILVLVHNPVKQTFKLAPASQFTRLKPIIAISE